MSWEELGIQNPDIKWKGIYQDWHTNRLGALFETTMDEVEDLQVEIEDIRELGLWPTQINDFDDWLGYIDTLLGEAAVGMDLRSGLMNTRIQLFRFKKQFDNFAVGIDWFGG